ncbi:MAG: matrixin family metalloprotease [Deltaproteobacteria bacterium]|nr:matrixin family metalloprotease [Deltaproteobacteria bacterium]
MRSSIPHVALLSATLVAWSCAGDPAADDGAAPAGNEPLFEEAGPDVIHDDGASVAVPPPGTSVITEAIFVDGRTKLLQVDTDDDGQPTLVDHDVAAPPEGTLAACVKPAACEDGAYSLTGHKWSATYRWWFDGASTPSEITAANAEAQLRSAAVNVTRSDNSCGFADLVDATSAFQGRTSSRPNITAAGTCATADGTSVVGFGDLPAGVLGVACTWTVNGVAVESDVQLNKVDHNWFTGAVPSNCANRFSLQAVATHEFGHTFGLGHVAECGHGQLTMSTQITACSAAASSLGRGDVRALRAVY